jgi:transposase
MIRYIGLDVHKRLVQVCALDQAGRVLLRLRFALDRQSLNRFAQEMLTPEDRVALEATTNTWAVVKILKPYVAEVAVSNPLQTKAIASAKIKTDKVDAEVLAQLLRLDYLPRVWEPDEATQELRRLTSRRAALVADRTEIKNRLHSVLAMRLIVPPLPALFSIKGLAWLRHVPLDAEGRYLIDSDLRLLGHVEEEIAGLDRMLIDKAYADPRVQLLMTQPGVDFHVAQAVLAALGDIRRFRDGDHAAGYLGLVPRTKQSAEHCYHGPITKHGNSHARWMLVQAAQHVRNHPGPLGVFFRRLAKKKNYNVAVVATARKLVVIAWHMLTRNEPYRYAQPQSTATKLARLRVKATGAKRRTGTKGRPRSAGYGSGVQRRTIKALPQVYQEEGLPALARPTAGESRMLAQSGTVAYVAALQQSHQVPRRRRGSAGKETIATQAAKAQQASPAAEYQLARKVAGESAGARKVHGIRSAKPVLPKV